MDFEDFELAVAGVQAAEEVAHGLAAYHGLQDHAVQGVEQLVLEVLWGYLEEGVRLWVGFEDFY